MIHASEALDWDDSPPHPVSSADKYSPDSQTCMCCLSEFVGSGNITFDKVVFSRSQARGPVHVIMTVRGRSTN